MMTSPTPKQYERKKEIERIRHKIKRGTATQDEKHLFQELTGKPIPLSEEEEVLEIKRLEQRIRRNSATLEDKQYYLELTGKSDLSHLTIDVHAKEKDLLYHRIRRQLASAADIQRYLELTGKPDLSHIKMQTKNENKRKLQYLRNNDGRGGKRKRNPTQKLKEWQEMEEAESGYEDAFEATCADKTADYKENSRIHGDGFSGETEQGNDAAKKPVATEGVNNNQATPKNPVVVYDGPPDEDVQEFGGWPLGWKKLVKERYCGHRDCYWICPSGNRYRSWKEVSAVLSQNFAAGEGANSGFGSLEKAMNHDNLSTPKFRDAAIIPMESEPTIRAPHEADASSHCKQQSSGMVGVEEEEEDADEKDCAHEEDELLQQYRTLRMDLLVERDNRDEIRYEYGLGPVDIDEEPIPDTPPSSDPVRDIKRLRHELEDLQRTNRNLLKCLRAEERRTLV